MEQGKQQRTSEVLATCRTCKLPFFFYLRVNQQRGRFGVVIIPAYDPNLRIDESRRVVHLRMLHPKVGFQKGRMREGTFERADRPNYVPRVECGELLFLRSPGSTIETLTPVTGWYER